MTLAIMLAIMVLTSNSLFAQKGELLYKGRYNCGPDVYPNGMSFPSAFNIIDIEIYANEIELLGFPGKFEYQETLDNGKRKYSGYNKRLFVDENFNLTLYRDEDFVGTIITRYTTNGSSLPQSGNYGGVGSGTYTGGGNKPTSTPTQQNTHKCGLCGGSGRVVENTTSFGNTKYCSECGKTVSDSHYHTTCPSCKGKGYW